MRRLITALLAAMLLAGLAVPVVGAASGASVAAASAVPKVVVIVGPAGSATDRYRAEARKAAALARKYTPDVTEIYSPNATWPAVKRALQGASLVLYMGHGNGWPSKYRDSLYPPSQNGFGLNPEAGSGDSAHQYFGESRIAESIRLADNAVVLLNHLCYASGNTEPGLSEGTLDQARQRVDNFAAGFIQAGAAAVVAEAYASPNHMVKAVLASSRSIESAWRNAPSRNGNAFGFKSERSPGFVAQMDPEHAESGFTRSIVLKEGLASSDVLANARGSAAGRAPGVDPVELAPTLARAGIDIKLPTLTSTSAGTTISYKVPYTVKHRKELPKKMMASVRWDAIDLAPLDPTAEAAAAGAESATDPDAMPDLGLVTPERAGDVVAPVKVKLTKKAFSFKADAPTTPGRYRLTVILHDGDGVAFDPVTQAQLPALIVRVTGDLDAEIVAPATTRLEPGSTSALSVWVANLGIADWGHPAVHDPRDREGSAPATMARVTGTWVALGGVDDPGQLASAGAAAVTPVQLPAGLEPGAVVPVDLQLFAPSIAGDYLLILDVLDPDKGSLIANGVEPTIIRVNVAAAPAPDPEPSPDTLAADQTAATDAADADAAAADPDAAGADETSSAPDPASIPSSLPSSAPIVLPAGASRP